MSEKKNKTYTLVLLFIYLAVLTWIILFKLGFGLDLGYLRGINLIPFHYDIETAGHFAEIRDNVIIFVPLGLYLGLLGVKPLFSIVSGFAVSAVLELLQYILGVGVTDITDLITNTLGTALGVLIFAVLTLIFKNRPKLERVLRILATVATLLFLAFAAVVSAFNS
ncbi:MAG: VanZ family protein [Clostridiales bacterium]|jgi:glycopeptide antibiotics resistance protein|nr:VanZ family protein [Clostridiales bacterium]